MSENYSESMFKAIDTIISQRLNGVSYDKTELCTIVEQNKDDKTRYWVTNEAGLKYEAYSLDETKIYSEKSKVYVIVPQGNYELTKLIIGRYTAEKDNSVLYSNPFENLLQMTKVEIVSAKEPLELEFTEGKTIVEQTKTNLNFKQNGIGQYDYIGIDFALTTGFGGNEGEFWLMLDFLDGSGKSLLNDNLKALLTFSSKQLYGNPYYLTPNLKFQHLFNFPLIYGTSKFDDMTLVKQIKVSLILYKDFNIKASVQNPKLILNEFSMYTGFDKKDEKVSTSKIGLVLDNATSTNYSKSNVPRFNMSVNWYDLNSGAIYNENNPKPASEENIKYEIFWFRYSESVGYVKRLENGEEHKWFLSNYKNDLNEFKKAINEAELFQKNKKVTVQEKYAFLLGELLALYNSNQQTFYKKVAKWVQPQLLKKQPKNFRSYFSRKNIETYYRNTKKDYKRNLINILNVLDSDPTVKLSLENHNKDLFNIYCSLHNSNKTIYDFNVNKYFCDIKESGTYWKTITKGETINRSLFLMNDFSPSIDYETEVIKTAIRKTITTTEGGVTKTKYEYMESNALTFENQDVTNPTGSNEGKQETLKLVLSEGDDGIYNVYGIDNKLLGNANSEVHGLTVNYVNNGLVWDETIQKVTWYIPTKGTMLLPPMIYDDDTGNKILGDGWSGNAETDKYYKYESSVEDDAKTISFGFTNQYNYSSSDNTIKCEIIRYKDSNKTEIYDCYDGSIELKFGIYGTAGTNWSFNITANKPSLTKKGDSIILTANLEDSTGQQQDFTSAVTWEWYQQNYQDNRKYTMTKIDDTSCKITFENTKEVDPFAIIKATYNVGTSIGETELTAYYPIAYGNDSATLLGASRVIYNTQGTNPSYDRTPYELINDEDGNVTYKYSIRYQDNKGVYGDTADGKPTDTNKLEIYNSIFHINNTTNILKPLSIKPTTPHKMAVQVLKLNTSGQYDTIYLQPILVLTNQYESSLLNTWDGSTVVDTNNNNILSALVGAGVKNSKNQFTGVLMGAVGNKADIASAVTGLYGFSEGQVVFKLDEHANFYVGTGSENRIQFSEGFLDIASKKFLLQTDDLIINSSATGNNPVFKFKSALKFMGNGNAQLGNWEIKSGSLMLTPDKYSDEYWTRVTDKTGKKYYDSNAESSGIQYQYGNNADIYIGTTNKALLAFSDTNYWWKNSNGDVVEGVRTAIKLGSNFGVQSNGTLYAKNAIISGKITANSGKIGGWTIKSNELKSSYTKDGKTYYCALKTPTNESTNVIAIGGTNETDYSRYTFRVRADGTVTAKGKITATSGKIGGCTIDEDGVLHVKDININGVSFSKVSGTKVNKNEIYASKLHISGGSLEFTQKDEAGVATGTAFEVTNNGTCKITDVSEKGTGFFTMGPGTTHHPYVSALNVAEGAGGISFRSGGYINDNGIQAAQIALTYYEDDKNKKNKPTTLDIYVAPRKNLSDDNGNAPASIFRLYAQGIQIYNTNKDYGDLGYMYGRTAVVPATSKLKFIKGIFVGTV